MIYDVHTVLLRSFYLYRLTCSIISKVNRKPQGSCSTSIGLSTYFHLIFLAVVVGMAVTGNR